MDVKLSTKRVLLSLLDECDVILREFLSVIASSDESVNIKTLLDLLKDKDAEMKALIPQVNEQIKLQKMMDYLKFEIDKRDKLVLSAQVHLRKAEIILNTALYYSRKKLNVIAEAVANPVDPEEVIKFGHRITTKHGILAPHDWSAGDKRRPFPTEETIRNGFLFFIDSNGDWSQNLVEFVSKMQESSLPAPLGVEPPKDQQPQQSSQPSPRISQQFTGQNRPLQPPDSIVHTSTVAALGQLPPGVNVVSSPAGGMHRAPPLGTAAAPVGYMQPGSMTSVDPRAANTPLMIATGRMPHQSDEVEVMTDSCSSSSSEGYN